MTVADSGDIKAVRFVNQDAYKEYMNLPPPVKEMADARTSLLQNGGRLPSKQVKSLSGDLSGISEIRIDFDDNTYRVYFAAEFEKVIYMLDSGLKK